MKSFVRAALPLMALVLLASCAGGDRSVEVGSAPTKDNYGAATGPVADYPVRVGPPYQVGGYTYVPADALDYDEVGYASHYGTELSGNRTASGELFNATGVSAAHRTLPLPSYVEVTALDTGKTILVRINDRGPFSGDRLIDLSSGAARQLGIEGKGVSAVRVRRVNPPEQERGYLRTGGRAPERLETPEPLLAALRSKLGGGRPMPKPDSRVVAAPGPIQQQQQSGRFIVEGEGAAPPAAQGSLPSGYRPSVPARGEPIPSSPAPMPVASGYVVQVAAFGSQARADELAKRIGARVMPSADGSIWRVRYGPYANESDAAKGLEIARDKGYDSAQISRADPG